MKNTGDDSETAGTRAGDAQGVSTAAAPRPGLLQRAHPGASAKGDRVDGAAAVLAKWALRTIIISVAAALLLWLAAQAWVVLFPAALGIMVATLLEPLARRLRPRLGATAASALVLLGGIAIVVVAIILLAPQVAGQVRPLALNVAAGVENLRELAAGKPFYIRDSQIGFALDDATNQVRSHALSIGGGVWTGVMGLGSVLLNAVLALVMCFFALKDGHRFIPWLSKLAGPTATPHITEVATRLWDALAGFVRAQALVGLVDSVAIGVALLLLDVPLAVPLAVLIFAGSFIPVIGALATGSVAALVALVAGGPMTALIVVIVVVVVNQVEGNVLAPLLLGKSLALHPVVIMGSVAVGTSAFGIVGAFLAVPVAASAATVFRYVCEQLEAADRTPGAFAAEEGAPEGPAEAAQGGPGEPTTPTRTCRGAKF